MKMGLSVIVVGHVTFILGALVHGAVLRNTYQHERARFKDYAVSDVLALISGFLGVIVGILAIVLSKHKKSKGLTWSLFTFSLFSSLVAAASTVGLFVSMVTAIINGGWSLLTHCRFPDAIGYSSKTNECPFDPTRVYSTTLILWGPLIVMCFIQLVFSARCFAACVSFLGLPCSRTKKRHFTQTIHVVGPAKEAFQPPRIHNQPSKVYTELSRIHNNPAELCSGAPRQLPRAPPRHHSRQPHRSHSERQPLRQTHRERSRVEPREIRAGSRGEREREQLQPLRRAAPERSSFWI
ncbi:transmembrane protein 54 isoform X2 [Nothobranchius furzeri]|nr:transmembrane protein 54 isoform X2 [Nothobranchius furzeri]